MLAGFFQGPCFPFWAGCRMRLLKDVNRKPRDLLWQPGLKYIRAFSFHFSEFLHCCWRAATFASMLGSPAQGTLLPGKLPLFLCRFGEHSRFLSRLCHSSAVPGWDTAPALPKASAQPLAGLSVWVSVAGVLQTGSCDCSQERPQCHRTDRSDIYFFFILLCLPRLWPQSPWSWNMANRKSGWWIYWMHSYGHLAVIKASLAGRGDELCRTETQDQLIITFIFTAALAVHLFFY